MKDNEFDIRITKGSGPGGQHRNKVETCAIVTHISTGLQEKCEDTRSKNKNIEIAKQRLIKKIEEQKNKIKQEKKNKKRIEAIHNSKPIRTYNYTRREVYDHRTKIKADLKRVMNGEIDLL